MSLFGWQAPSIEGEAIEVEVLKGQGDTNLFCFEKQCQMHVVTLVGKLNRKTSSVG